MYAISRSKLYGVLTAAMLLIITVLAAGCSSEREDDPEDGQPLQPVALQMFTLANSFTDDDFKRLVQEPVARLHPHISISMVEESAGVTIESLIVSGQFPDLVYTNTERIGDFYAANAVTDLTDWIRQSSIDLTRFQSAALDAAKPYSDKGELLGLPMSYNGAVMAYNLDIFDAFGVPYPQDGMTWTETIELARRVSGTVGEVQYIALDPNGVVHFGTTLSPRYVDPATNKATLATNEWRTIMDLFIAIKSIPGNTYQGNRMDRFFKNQDIALFASYDNIMYVMETAYQQGTSINADYVSYPSLDGLPGKALGFDAKTLMISSTTPHKKEAVDVISVLTGEDVQLMNVRLGRRSPLIGDQFMEAFGADLASLQSKNVQAFFLTEQTVKHPVTPEVRLTFRHLNQAANKILQGTDTNTALREAEELANQEIASLGR